MDSAQYNFQFDKLCNFLQLGDLVSAPKPLSGGLLHRMYAVETTLGKYAIKALNPQIMLRPTAMQNIYNSELIANIVANNISALPAKIFNKTSIQEIDKQYYLVFDWVDGKNLKPNEINLYHCEKVGAILANIHMTDFSKLGIINDLSDNIQLTNWNYYLQKGQENNSEWVALLSENIDRLYDCNIQINESKKHLSSYMIISHRDLDSKNVMWNKDKPFIIDWESAGYINPMYDLIDTAIYWSENETGHIVKERFLAFISGYKNRCETPQANWRMVLQNGFSGKLDWLEYSLKRSLWIECTDQKEQQMGTEQATATIKAINSYANMINELEKWLKDEFNYNE